MGQYYNRDDLKKKIELAFENDPLAKKPIPSYYGNIFATQLHLPGGDVGVATLHWNGVLGCMGTQTETREPQSFEYELKTCLQQFYAEYQDLQNSPGITITPDMEMEFELFTYILSLGYIPLLIFNETGYVPEQMLEVVEDLTSSNESRQQDILCLTIALAQYELLARYENEYSKETKPILEPFLSSNEDLICAADCLAAGYEVFRLDIEKDGFDNHITYYALGQTLQVYYFDRIGRAVWKKLESILSPAPGHPGTGVSYAKRLTPNDVPIGEMIVFAPHYKEQSKECKARDFQLLKNLAIECFATAWHGKDEVDILGTKKEQEYLLAEFVLIYGLLWNGYLPIATNRPSVTSYQPVFMKPVFDALLHNAVHFKRAHPELQETSLLNLYHFKKLNGVPILSNTMCRQYLDACPHFHLY